MVKAFETNAVEGGHGDGGMRLRTVVENAPSKQRSCRRCALSSEENVSTERRYNRKYKTQRDGGAYVSMAKMLQACLVKRQETSSRPNKQQLQRRR
jgi:hypothetical protein